MNDATMIEENKLINAQAELAISFICKNCGNDCPSGTLDNGLCSDCDLIGKEIMVEWRRFGMWTCKVVKVSKNGTIYAVRWNRKQGEYTKPRAIIFVKGYWRLK